MVLKTVAKGISVYKSSNYGSKISQVRRSTIVSKEKTRTWVAISYFTKKKAI